MPAELPLAPIDVCTIFANACDNAIEACTKIVEGEKLIEINVYPQEFFLVISFKNSVDVAPIIINNCITTTTKDAKHHGYGLKSIKDAVEKYGGFMELSCNNNKFLIDICLKIQM